MKTIFSIIILGGTIWFAISNSGVVTLKLFLWEYTVSLALIVAVCFLLGFILGIFRLAPDLWNKGSTVKTAHKKLSQMELERDELQKRVEVLEFEKVNRMSSEVVG